MKKIKRKEIQIIDLANRTTLNQCLYLCFSQGISVVNLIEYNLKFSTEKKLVKLWRFLCQKKVHYHYIMKFLLEDTHVVNFQLWAKLELECLLLNAA